MKRQPALRAVDWAWLLLMLVILLVGYVTAGDYGLSWDEPDNSVFGRQALQAYMTLRAPSEWQSNLESKGPFFVAIVEAVTPFLEAAHGSWSDVDARHFSYFLTLPLGATALYSLARRIVSPLAAFGAAALFFTQPLVYGHAFINPKDTPFMAFFLVSMALGAWMVEVLHVARAGRMDGGRWTAVTLAAGIALGLTTAIRLFGPLAGALVSFLALSRLRRRALGPLGVYWTTAAATAYATWPYLWGDPWRRLTESLEVMMNFPWDNLVLYRGLVYNVNDLPWHYLPFTTIIQVTETALVLALAGGVVALVAMLKDPPRRSIYLVLFLWAAVPYATALFTHAQVYDNSRQFLFAQPPLFLAAAVALEAVLRKIQSGIARATIVALALVPGMIGILRLHPYEYVYYNQLVGGVRGAYRRYELDYWATSYREAMEELNTLASRGSIVEVVGPWLSAASFARPDLVVVKSGSARDDTGPADYFMVMTRGNLDQGEWNGAPTVVRVEVEGAVLSEVRLVSGEP